MKRTRAPLPDPRTSFTHSCNNLASYEVKKNPNPDPYLKSLKKVTTKGSDLTASAAPFGTGRTGKSGR